MSKGAMLSATSFGEDCHAPDGRVQTTSQVFDHVGRLREALKEFFVSDVRVQGVLTNPRVRAASPMWGRKAILRLRHSR